MFYIILLFIFNVFIIIILANVKTPSVNVFLQNLTKYQLDKTMRLQNRGASLSEIDFDKYHSIFMHLNKEKEDESK